jgi:hypothetical protein
LAAVGESSRSHGADEAALARRASAGDVHAFLTLHRRHERRVYDLCFRILGSQVEAVDATRETFLGVLRGAPGLLASAREACHRRLDLPGVAAHEREVLALSELEHLSYDEIAEIMGIDWDSVAQLHDWALAPEAEESEECERALPLIALEQDGGLDPDSNEAGWLEEHLMHCRPCRTARDAMRVAAAAPPAPPAAAEPRHPVRHLLVACALVSLLVLALLVAVSHEGPLALIVPPVEEDPAAAAAAGGASGGTAERSAEPAGARAGKKAARRKGSVERSGRERRARERRERARASRVRQRAAKRERRQRRSERPRTGGVAAPPPERGAERPEERGGAQRRPRRQVQVERRPDRGGQDELVPAPSPVPPPTETAPVQPTPGSPPG